MSIVFMDYINFKGFNLLVTSFYIFQECSITILNNHKWCSNDSRQLIFNFLFNEIRTIFEIYFFLLKLQFRSSLHTYLDILFSLDPLRIHKRCSKCLRVDVSEHCLLAILCTDTFAAQMQLCHLVQSIHSRNQ